MPSYLERLLNSNVTNVEPPPNYESQSQSSERDQENDAEAALALIHLSKACSSKKRPLQQQQQQKDETAVKHRRRVSCLSISTGGSDNNNKKSAPSFRRGATPRLLLERFRDQGGTPANGVRVAVSLDGGIYGGTVERVICDGSSSGTGVDATSLTCKIVVIYDDNRKTETLEYPDYVNAGIALLGDTIAANGN